jgi:hypothetical protein
VGQGRELGVPREEDEYRDNDPLPLYKAGNENLSTTHMTVYKPVECNSSFYRGNWASYSKEEAELMMSGIETLNWLNNGAR